MDLVKVIGGGPAERAKEATTKLVEDAGYDLLEIRYEREGKNMNLTYLIDRRGGVTLDDCEKVTELLNPVLDETEISKKPYFLIVSSPGVDRPFEHERDFLRYLDHEVEVSLYKKLPDGRKKFSAWLRAYDDGELTLTETKDGPLEGEGVLHIPATDYSLVKQMLRF